jgi:hypothetical protein
VRPSISVEVPDGTSALFPASMQGEPDERCRSPKSRELESYQEVASSPGTLGGVKGIGNKLPIGICVPGARMIALHIAVRDGAVLVVHSAPVRVGLVVFPATDRRSAAQGGLSRGTCCAVPSCRLAWRRAYGEHLRIPPGNRPKAMTGYRPGQNIIYISDQRRPCFR